MHHSKPLVSVVIPCYNHEQFVQDSIQSVIDQTYYNIELIIIDDGSKDNSVLKIQEMIELCEQRFVRFEFRTRANIGLSATLNEALDWCKGKYYSPNASDDMILKDKTAIQVGFLEKNSDITVVFGGVKLINNNNVVLQEFLSEEKVYNFKDIIMHQHDLPTPTYMTRLESIKKVGGYNSNLIIEDWYMWLKLSKIGTLLYINEVFALYRQHDNNMSKNLKKMQQGRLDVLSYFKESEYYEDAIANIAWYNDVERFTNNKNFVNYLYLGFKYPMKTVKLTINSLSFIRTQS